MENDEENPDAALGWAIGVIVVFSLLAAIMITAEHYGWTF